MSFTNPRWRDVFVAAIARAVDQGGTLLAAVTLQITLLQRGHGGLVIADLLLAAAVPPILLAAVAGRVTDRYDSRALLLIIGPLQALTALALAFATSTPAILALVAALSAGATITAPTFSALTPAMVGRDNLAKASGIIQTAGGVGMLAGPALGGLLVGAYGSHVPLLIDAVSFLVIPLAAILIKTRRGAGHAVAEPDSAGVREDWTIWRDPVARPVVVLFAVVIGIVTAADVVEVFLVLDSLHSTATVYGVISTLWIVGSLIASAVVGRVRLGDPRSAAATVLALGGICLVALLAGAVPAAGWLLPLWLLGGLANGVLNVLVGVLVIRRAPAARRGRAGAALGGTLNAATTIGYGAGGLLMSLTGSPRAVMAGAGLAGAVVCGIVGTPLLRAVRSTGRAADGPLPSVAGRG